MNYDEATQRAFVEAILADVIRPNNCDMTPPLIVEILVTSSWRGWQWPKMFSFVVYCRRVLSSEISST
jgi:hypothetical protein